MFTTPCFIRKNTKEIREKLNALGHKPNDGKVLGEYLCVSPMKDGDDWCYIAASLSDLKKMQDFDNAIDCGENEDLFLAISALSSDKRCQWFILDAKEDKEDGTCKWKLYDDNPNWNWWIFESHKATVEELIEHFKQ